MKEAYMGRCVDEISPECASQEAGNKSPGSRIGFNSASRITFDTLKLPIIWNILNSIFFFFFFFFQFYSSKVKILRLGHFTFPNDPQFVFSSFFFNQIEFTVGSKNWKSKDFQEDILGLERVNENKKCAMHTNWETKTEG